MVERPDTGGRRDEGGRPGADERRDPGRRVVASNRYSLLVGLVFAVIAVVALVNTIGNRDTGTLGFGSEKPGSRLAPFAVPDVASDLEGDANIDPKSACKVDLPGAIRLCDFAEEPLVISFWFTRGGDCEAQQDVVSAVYDRFRAEAGFLSINVRDDREEVAAMANERGWDMPVGHDRDGALSNLYRVGGCPTFAFVRPGLKLDEAVVGDLSVEEMSSRVEDLIKRYGEGSGSAGATGAPGAGPRPGRA